MDLAQFIFETRVEFPGFRIRQKNQSWLMKVIAAFLWVITLGRQRTFMTGYITTLGPTVYVPEGWHNWHESRRLAILRHERVHMRQARRYGFVLFALLYVFVPLPLGLAYCRARFEWEAYEESMRAAVEQHGKKLLDDNRYRASIVREFTSAAYGWMWPFPRAIERWYDASKKKILAERFYEGRFDGR